MGERTVFYPMNENNRNILKDLLKKMGPKELRYTEKKKSFSIVFLSVLGMFL